MEWVDFAALALATSGVLDAWFRGSLFAGARAVMELKEEAFQNPLPKTGPGSREHTAWTTQLQSRGSATLDESPSVEESLPWSLRVVDAITPNFVGALLSCALCLSYHVSFWLGLVFWVPSLWLAEPWSVLLKFPLYALAATRVGNIVTGLLPARLQYQPDLDEHSYPPTGEPDDPD